MGQNQIDNIRQESILNKLEETNLVQQHQLNLINVKTNISKQSFQK